MILLMAQVFRWCKDQDIGLVLVGPEAPLVSGLIDALKAGGIRQGLRCYSLNSQWHPMQWQSADVRHVSLQAFKIVATEFKALV